MAGLQRGQEPGGNMTGHARAKQERIIEAVRMGLEGDAALDFVREGGYALTPNGMMRYLRQMGGRGEIAARIKAGKTNLEILQELYPEEEVHLSLLQRPSQGELFDESSAPSTSPFLHSSPQLFESTKMTVYLPNELYEALRLYSHAQGKSRNDAVIDLMTAALSRLPDWHAEELGSSTGSGAS